MSKSSVRDTQSFARLVASENLQVFVNPAATGPSFNPKARVLTLPVWDTTESIQDAMILHEVGHALYTPQDAISSVERASRDLGADLDTTKWYVNVLEDARVDGGMIRQYPGAVKDFKAAYGHFHKDRKAFGIEPGATFEDLKSLPLIDRVNLHQKLGRFGILDVPFTVEEARMVQEIDRMRSFDDVMAMTKRVMTMDPNPDTGSMASMLDFQMEGALDEDMDREGQQPGESEGESEGEGEGEGEGQGQGEGEGQGEGQGEGDGQGDGDGQGNGQGEGQSGANGSGSGQSGQGAGEDQDDSRGGQASTGPKGGLLAEGAKGVEGSPANAPKPKTAQAFESSARTAQTRATRSETHTLRLDKPVTRGPGGKLDGVAPYQDFLKATGYCRRANQKGPQVLVDFRAENKAVIASMAQRFEMKKAADMSKRVRVSKTGVIDSLKMNTYKWNDDIFRKNTSVKEGKNHGLVMIIDWSGSMDYSLNGAIRQALVLSEFCRKVRIPFEVYAFSDCYPNSASRIFSGVKQINADKPHIQAGVRTGGCTLIQFLSNKMKPAEYNLGAQRLLEMGLNGTSGNYSLSGTPLSEAVVLSREVVNEFKAKNRVQIPHCIFLTDGDGGGSFTPNINSYDSAVNLTVQDDAFGYSQTETHTDSYHITREITDRLLKWARATTGAHYINFFIDGQCPPNLHKQYKEDGIVAVTPPETGYRSGWSEYYVVSLAQPMTARVRWDDPNSDGATILKAIAKTDAGRKKILGRFVDLIASEMKADLARL